MDHSRSWEDINQQMARIGFILVFVKAQHWISAPINPHKFTFHDFRTRFNIKFVHIPFLQRITLFRSSSSVCVYPSPYLNLPDLIPLNGVQIMERLIMQWLPPSNYSLHLRSRYCPRHPDFNILEKCFPLRRERFHTHTKRKSKFWCRHTIFKSMRWLVGEGQTRCTNVPIV